MTSAIAIVLAEYLGTAAVAAAVFLLLRRMLPVDMSVRYSSAVATAVAFAAGYAMLPSWAAWVPNRHWQWAPWLALLAAVVGPISLAGGLRRVERWLLSLGVSILAAWLLVPVWPSLQPSRAVLMPALAIYLLLCGGLLEPLLARFSTVTLPAYLTLSAACVSVLTAALVSVTYGRAGGTVAAALAGRSIAAYFVRDANAMRGLGMVYAVLVGGWAFVGCIEQQDAPLYPLLLLPAAPLALWCCVRGPLSRLHGFAATGVQAALVVATLVVAAGLLARNRGESDDYDEYGRNDRQGRVTTGLT
jgi:hypothetical protein